MVARSTGSQFDSRYGVGMDVRSGAQSTLSCRYVGVISHRPSSTKQMEVIGNV